MDPQRTVVITTSTGCRQPDGFCEWSAVMAVCTSITLPAPCHHDRGTRPPKTTRTGGAGSQQRAGFLNLRIADI